MKKSNLLFIGLIISLLLHLSTFLTLNSAKLDLKKGKNQDTIEIDFIANNQQMDPNKLQIVEQNSKPLNDEVSNKAKYWSQFNQAVENETKAQNTGKFNNEGGQGILKKGSSAINNDIAKQAKKSKKTNWDSNGNLSFQEKFSPKMDWSNLAKKNETLGVENPGDISQTSDYLKETTEGPQTLLNTREFVYYSYFNRIKSQIQQVWEPKIKEKITAMFLQGRSIASNKDRITKLLIVLNEKGTLIGVQVVNESGIEDLDSAAIEAFKAAAPFPNPPAGIIEQDGKIKIQWDFVLEV